MILVREHLALPACPCQTHVDETTDVPDLKDGSSCKFPLGISRATLIATATGLKACVYQVRIVGEGQDREVHVEAPHASEVEGSSGRRWELVEMRGVSEGRLVPILPQNLS
jgi:hypothetical protein